MRENRVYIIVYVCLKFINYIILIRDSCFKDLLLFILDWFYFV